MLLGLVLGKTAYSVSVLWTGSMASYFVLKTLSNNYSTSAANPLRMPVLCGLALLHFVSIWCARAESIGHF